MQLFSALACFSPSVPSGIKVLWGENGGEIARSAHEKRYSNYYFCNGLSDPWLPELSINGSRVVFHANWVRNSVDAGYRLSLARYVLDDRFEILNRPKVTNRHASTPMRSPFKLSSPSGGLSESVETMPTPRLYASKRRLSLSLADRSSESKRSKLSVTDILTLTPRPVSRSDATPGSMSESFSSQEVRAALSPSNAQESTPFVQSTRPSMLPTRSSPVPIHKETQSITKNFKSTQSAQMSLQSSQLSAVPSKISAKPHVVSTEKRDIPRVSFGDSSDPKEQERRYGRSKAKRHSLPSNFWASITHPATGSTACMDVLMTISIDKMLTLPEGLEQELDFFKPGTTYKGKEFRAVECRRRRTV